MHKKLFIPGPVEVREEVLRAMSTPMIGHRTKDATILQKGISEKLQKVFQTASTILLSTSSGTGLMEGAVRCTTVKGAIVFSVGAFGNRWFELAECNNLPAEKHEVPWGQAITPELVDQYLSTGKYDVITLTHNETSTGIMNPVGDIARVVAKYPDVVFLLDCVSSMGGVSIPVDEWGVDVAITSTQKALGLPPGLAICSVSGRAIERMKQVKYRGAYLDLLALYEYILKKDYQYPSTPSLSHMYALDVQLDYILNVEGLENRWKRHSEMANTTREWANRHFQIFPDKLEWASDTLTTIRNTRNISVKDLNTELGKRGFSISNGYGDLKEKTFRIAHMADCQPSDLQEVLGHIEEILGL
ncbi:MAG: aminotransferase [Candidatus Wallbacteria bacterium HGW-Wallbacteria-1]|uniref:Aminotransferase n=1 Tax=Candidatus Wallbacteria bacterium HGW-Wallbacteria-1 TaxID=2013854 RepID=A0A2N1PK86_9BACT|nr:MAG: aminotransferase [Candidatus Wallbacteria bacterium HGW-Wallbacteria-1]